MYFHLFSKQIHIISPRMSFYCHRQWLTTSKSNANQNKMFDLFPECFIHRIKTNVVFISRKTLTFIDLTCIINEFALKIFRCLRESSVSLNTSSRFSRFSKSYVISFIYLHRQRLLFLLIQRTFLVYICGKIIVIFCLFIIFHTIRRILYAWHITCIASKFLLEIKICV